MKKIFLILIVLVIFSINNVNAKIYNNTINNEIYYSEDNIDLINLGNDLLINNERRLFDGENENNDFGGNGPCTRLKSPLKFIGYILLIVKIVIPLILIIFGVIDLFKAVTSGKDGEITKSLKTFVFRLIAGVAIFFVPTIISFIFSLVDGFDSVESEFSVCQKCILNVSQCN